MRLPTITGKQKESGRSKTFETNAAARADHSGTVMAVGNGCHFHFTISQPGQLIAVRLMLLTFFTVRLRAGADRKKGSRPARRRCRMRQMRLLRAGLKLAVRQRRAAMRKSCSRSCSQAPEGCFFSVFCGSKQASRQNGK